MKRIQTSPRPDWKKKVESLGFNYHTIGEIYWDESAYYSFTLAQINQLEEATNTLWQMYLEATDYVIQQKLYDVFHIPKAFHQSIYEAWNNDVPSIYGRFDLCYNGKDEPKLLEFNGDTPTSVFEASVVQWHWLQEQFNNKDQFNSIHEKLIAYWRYLTPYLQTKKIHFASVNDSLEDYTNTIYLLDTAQQAGFDTQWLALKDMGWDEKRFVDLEEKEIFTLFKLYPWEWLMNEEFGQHILQAQTQWIEPSWKVIMSSKALLPILWRLFPKHKNLLPTFTNANTLSSYAKKPIYSREGNNISLVENGQLLSSTTGEYGEEGYIFQELCKLPNFDGNYPVIGSWIVGQEAAGIGIRETKSLITDNLSRFIPHLIEG
jgi:glutathionylspermidine synthase